MNSDFTGLALITGVITPGVEAAIMKTLAPFTIKILDKQSMQIRDRYFLAIHFALDKAHAKAIESDLIKAAEKLNMDLVVDYR